MTLAELLSEARSQCGFSLSIAAAFLGMSKGHLHQMETGKESNPTLANMAAFVRVYGIKPEAFIDMENLK